jgi:putative FmdB family regulatory protein
MPLYEYECENCGTRFERIQSIKDEPIQQCPECSGAVHKIFHAAGIIFKGSGWYITDSRKSTSSAVTGGDSKTADTETKPASTESKSAETKAETKTESKTGTKAESKSESKSESKIESKSESK